jgi:hypothetical protein
MINNKKPLILLDVDGVINYYYAFFNKTDNDYSNRKKYNIKNETLHDDIIYDKYLYYSPTIVKTINEWSDKAEILWLTSWKESARTRLAPNIGLKDFECSILPERIEKYGRLPKCEAAYMNFLKNDEDRIIIWIDDELGHFKQCFNDGKTYEYINKDIDGKKIFYRNNTIYVSPFNGLCKEHIESINDILNNPELYIDKCIDIFYPGKQIFLRG